MREILFRAWDKVSKKYREFDGMHDTMTINEDGKVEYYNLQNGSGGDEYILEQFTGLIDKNGKKIFEGDILHEPYRKTKNVIVTYKDGNFHLVPVGIYSASSSGELSFCKQNIDYFKYKIIGNIHDNPELLS